MNAAILLVTTAWFAGAEAAPATTAAPAATSAGTVMSTHATGTGALGAGCCGGAHGCDCGCECDCCCKPSLFQRLRARMHRNNCCCETSCGCCGNVGGCCGGAHGCDCGCDCDCCCKPSLFQRLRARMHCNNCCCETSCCCGGCGSGAGVGGVGVPGVMPGAEPIKLPKDATPGNKLPSSGKSGGTVQSHGLGLTPASSANLLETEKNPF